MNSGLEHPEYNKFIKYSSIYQRILGGTPEKDDHEILFMSRNEFTDMKAKEAIIIFSKTNIASDSRYHLEGSRYLFNLIQETKSFEEPLVKFQFKKRGQLQQLPV